MFEVYNKNGTLHAIVESQESGERFLKTRGIEGGTVKENPEVTWDSLTRWTFVTVDLTTFREVMKFLCSLWESGDTNMYGASPYIREMFPEVSKKQSYKLLSFWMENFDEIKNAWELGELNTWVPVAALKGPVSE